MIKKLLQKLMLLLCLTMVGNPAYSQVTIGFNEEPVTGALLALKDGTTGDSNENSSKGLGLPRVELQAYNQLKMGANAEDLTDQGAIHTGLIVYHLVSASDVCANIPSGVYVWDGTKWNPLVEKEAKQRPSVEYDMTSTTGLDQPNSYIVSESAVVKIPIDKAIKVWDGTSWQGDVNTGVGTLGAVLPTKKDVANMNLEAKLVWSDDQCSDLILNASNMQIKGKGSNAYIEVWVGNKKGNAVVALVEKGKSPQTDALWSWHIWATDQPEQKKFNNYTWLDRNIGAISSKVADVNSVGLLFQWGRKDPIIGSGDWTNKGQTVYDTDGNVIDYEATSYLYTANSNSEENLIQSITHPLSFIISQQASSDWYNATEGDLWNDRWNGSDTKKSPSDPCPEGWHVPDGEGGSNTYPWNDTTSPWGGGLSRINSSFDSTKGYDWANAGYYPAAGYRCNGVGVLRYVGEKGMFWTGAPEDNKSRSLNSSSDHADFWGADYRALGLSVRCIADK